MTTPPIDNYLIDMDGVLVREEQAIPGADRFIRALQDAGRPYLLLTNNSVYTPRDLAVRLEASGLHVPEESIWTAALATARFLHEQRPGGRAYVIGEAGLTTALHGAGYVLADRDPDYVVLGETRSYSIERITRGVRLIAAGARFIAANPDVTGPSERQSCRQRCCGGPISKATGVEPYFIGKPNPLMMREALRRDQLTLRGDRDGGRSHGHRRRSRESRRACGSSSSSPGVTSPDMVERFPYRRTSRIVDSVADLIDEIESPA